MIWRKCYHKLAVGIGFLILLFSSFLLTSCASQVSYLEGSSVSYVVTPNQDDSGLMFLTVSFRVGNKEQRRLETIDYSIAITGKNSLGTNVSAIYTHRGVVAKIYPGITQTITDNFSIRKIDVKTLTIPECAPSKWNDNYWINYWQWWTSVIIEGIAFVVVGLATENGIAVCVSGVFLSVSALIAFLVLGGVISWASFWIPFIVIIGVAAIASVIGFLADGF